MKESYTITYEKHDGRIDEMVVWSKDIVCAVKEFERIQKDGREIVYSKHSIISVKKDNNPMDNWKKLNSFFKKEEK